MPRRAFPTAPRSSFRIFFLAQEHFTQGVTLTGPKG